MVESIEAEEADRMDTASTRRHLMDQYKEANGGSTVTWGKNEELVKYGKK